MNKVSGSPGWLGTVIAPVAVLALLAGCQSVAPAAATADDGQARRAAALAAADWGRMQSITVEMHDHGYRPRDLALKVGQPYRLTLVNVGSVNHYFSAPEFFASVASRKAEVARQAEVKAPVFSSFEVFARGGSIDVYFIPLDKGVYRAHCHIQDHLKLNIEAKITVE